MMKKGFMRILSFLMIVMLVIPCFGMVAYAQETSETEEEPQIVTFEIPTEGETGYIAVPLSSSIEVDQTFTMTSSHRGADRTYTGSYLTYSITVTDSSGNACDSVVMVELYDYNHASARQAASVSASGATYTYANLPITSGRVYYFKYTVTSGTSQSLRVHMVINSYS